jgi:DNA repair exonuclease SbcCD nuclease subunit
MQGNGAVPVRATYRFVHASDLHLDAPVRGIPAPSVQLRDALRDAAACAWQSLVELALARDAAFVILAGGLFGEAIPGLRSCVALRDGLERLGSRAIEVFVALNCDDAAAAARLPWLTSGATLFAADEMSTASVMRDGQCLATLRGTSGDAADARQRARDLRPLGPGLEIGVLPDQSDANATTWAAEQLPASGLHYWALGGAAAGTVVHESPWIVFAGTPQGRGLAAPQLGPKGCMVVEVEDGHIGSVTPAALDHVRFLHVEVDASGCNDAAALRRLVVRELERRAAGAGDRIIVADAALHGRLSGGAARDRLAFEGALLAELRRESATRPAPLWWVRVRDLTVSEERHRSGGSRELRRIVSEQSEALGAPLPGSTFLARTFAPLLRQWDGETELAAQRELVRDATRLALDMIGGDESA